MPKGGKRFSFRNFPNEEGFTYVEILASILILSIIGILIWQGSIVASRTLFRSSDVSISSTRLLQLDEAMRREIGKIAIPYWLSLTEIEASPRRLVIPYYGGDPDVTLLIERIEDYISLTISGREQHLRLGPFPGLHVEQWQDEVGNVIGIMLRFDSPSDDAPIQELFFRFGSFPLTDYDETE